MVRVVDSWPSLPFGGSPRGRFCTASSCFSSGSSNLLRRGHHFRWVGILADLCTGKLVFPMSFGVVPHLPLVWSCATDLPQSLPGGARGGLLLSVPGGGPCPCLMLYIVPMVIDCLFCALGPSDYVLTVPLWAIISGRSHYLFYPIGTMCFPGRVEVALTNRAAVDVRVVGVRRCYQFRWAGILADLCTGKPVCPMSFGVVLRHRPPYL